MTTTKNPGSSRRPSLHRRRFLHSCAGFGALGLASTFGNLQLIGTAAAQGATDYKALVCIFLFGGNDSFNLIAPRDPAEHAYYASERRALAISRAALDAAPCLPLSYSDGRRYGFNPYISPLTELFNQRQLAFIVNIGTLLAPITKAEYKQQINRPLSLYSHSDQQFQWQSAGFSDRSFAFTGWGGRIADMVASQNTSSSFLTSISVAGNNALQVGLETSQYNFGVDGLGGIRLPGSNRRREHLAEGIRQVALASPHPFAQALGGIRERSFEIADEVNAALDGTSAPQTQFPDSSLGRQLSSVARMISIGPTLGLRRQVFFCAEGGWDTHNDQANAHPALLGDLSASMRAFHDATGELGVRDKVTTMSASDFGRTFNANGGDGSDHGWGGIQMVMGGAVRGGDLYGRMPDFTVSGPEDTGRRGTYIPTTAVDEMVSTLALWFGVSPSELTNVVPNIGAFDGADLGFMA